MTCDGVRLALRVTPRARRPGIGGTAPGRDGTPRLKVAVTAPPADGAANAAVLAVLAEALDLPRSALTLIAGASDRDKIVRVEGDPEPLLGRLGALAESDTRR